MSRAESNIKDIKEVRERVDAFHSQLDNEDLSLEWTEDFEQLQELDKLRESLENLQILAEDICDDIGHPIDHDATPD